ncbi:precorrin-6A reductase [Microlunatus endophyticus]|uniref:Precorrin-6A reductase n=1 Tax=Microlunatus endophyticus TaxID=1716077 RepID=A0A917S6M4_9ACTN|nr:cobalt-precorrin-6A reductase [Microlunatus endophyticus]GGL59622.1 precorrin-6A reductase [Microlunatus endophyticus]
MILILGGTAEARKLAALLSEAGHPVTSSLAGRVSNPAMPVGAVRIGGFGGTDGLIRYLRGSSITAIVDATHPFAATMSEHAAAAAAATGLPLLRLTRPGWSGHPGATSWIWVPDLHEAVAAGDSSNRPFITTGRQTLDAYAGWAQKQALVRLVEMPAALLPTAWTVVRSRGPYDLDSELELFTRYGVDLLVTKDSGGRHTIAKLDAAGRLAVPVIIIARPPLAAAPEVGDPVAAAQWISDLELHQPGDQQSG